MRLHNLIENTLVEGPGLRTAIWLQGCEANCPGCFNKAANDLSPNAGYEASVEILMQKLRANKSITGITIAGGEPLLQVEELTELLRRVSAELTHLNILLYTGYDLKKLMSNQRYHDCCGLADVIIFGPFIQALSPDSRRWIGSRNQEAMLLSDKLVPELDPWPLEDNKSEIEISSDGRVLNVCGNEVKL